MSKLLKIVGIIAAIGVLGYVFTLVFVSPTFENDKVTLTTNFLENLSSDDICDTHFNSDTKVLCTVFKGLYEDESTLTYAVVASGTSVLVTFTDPDTSAEVEYTFTFIEETNTGIGALFHKTNYLIDIIE